MGLLGTENLIGHWNHCEFKNQISESKFTWQVLKFYFAGSKILLRKHYIWKLLLFWRGDPGILGFMEFFVWIVDGFLPITSTYVSLIKNSIKPLLHSFYGPTQTSYLL